MFAFNFDKLHLIHCVYLYCALLHCFKAGLDENTEMNKYIEYTNMDLYITHIQKCTCTRVKSFPIHAQNIKENNG